jgi:hypothetical protein
MVKGCKMPKCKTCPKKTTTKKPAVTKTVVAYQVPDSMGGCPNTGRKAGDPLITKVVTVTEDSYVMVTGHMIRLYSGRADLYLNRNNKRIDYTLTYSPSKQWMDGQVYWVGSITKGSHTFTITGSKQGIFGCGSAWGDLDILVVPNLKGVAAYQWGVTEVGCPIKGRLKFERKATVEQESVAWVNGHIISKSTGSRPDLHLYVDGVRRDYALSHDTTGQWIDQNVMHAIALKKGEHTFELRGTKTATYGCGHAWGDLDVLVVPEFYGVAAYNQPDTQSGCPKSRGAYKDLIEKTITLDQTSIVKVAGHMIRTYRGRADLYLYVNGIKRDYSLSFTKNKIWQDVKLHFVTKLKKGKHSFALRSNKANALGCGGSWGDIDILVLPEKMTAVLAKDSTEPKKTTPKKPKTTKKMCPKVAIKCKCGHTYTMVKGCSMPKCKTCTTPKKVKTTPKKPTIKVTYKFAFNGCCRGTRASSWKLQGEMEAQYCTKRCTEDKNCNAVEVNGCRKNQCKGKCWHFYGDAKGTLTNGGCQTNGDMKCYAKSTSTMSTKLILKRIVGKTSNTQAKDTQIVYLDRHDVNARAGGVLTSFKFTPGGGNRMYYRYTYVKFPASTVGKFQ